MVVDPLTPVLQPWEGRRTQVHSHPQLYMEFKDTLKYIRSCLRKQKLDAEMNASALSTQEVNEGFQVFCLNVYDCFSFLIKKKPQATQELVGDLSFAF